MSKKQIVLGVGVAGAAACGLASYFVARHKERARTAQTSAVEDDGTVPFTGDDFDAFLLDMLDARPDADRGMRAETLGYAAERRYGKKPNDFLQLMVGVSLSALRREGLVQKMDTPTGTFWSSVPPKTEEPAPPPGWKERVVAAYQTATARHKARASGKEF